MTVARTLATDRLVLRQPEAADFPAYRAYCASDRSRFVHGPFSEAQAFDKFAAMIGHWTLRGFGRYVITRQDRPIGHVGPLGPIPGETPEMTWTLWDGAAEGQGYATEAAAAVASHLLDDCHWPGLTVLILPDNRGSVRIAERIGAALTETPAPDWYPGALVYRLSRKAAA